MFVMSLLEVWNMVLVLNRITSKQSSYTKKRVTEGYMMRASQLGTHSTTVLACVMIIFKKSNDSSKIAMLEMPRPVIHLGTNTTRVAD